MNKKLYILLLLSFVFIQCKDRKEIPVANNNVAGKYIDLPGEQISLFLPENINLISNDEYISYLNAIENKQIKKLETARFKSLKYSRGSFFMLGSDDNETNITFKSVPYIEIDQAVSQQLLKYLNKEHKAGAEVLQLESSFSRAGIIKKGQDRIFRAIFLYKGIDLLTGEDVAIYTYFYLVNQQDKSFVLTINSLDANDYDSYIQKIKL